MTRTHHPANTAAEILIWVGMVAWPVLLVVAAVGLILDVG